MLFPALIDKLTRHEDLTSDEARAAMTEVMRAAAAHIAGLLVGLAMKASGRPRSSASPRDAAHAVQVSKRHERVFTRAAPAATGLAHSHLVVRGGRHRRLRCPRREARQPVVLSSPQRRRVRSARRPVTRHRRSSNAVSPRRASDFFFAPTFIRRCAIRTGPKGPRGEDRVQSARALTNPAARRADRGRAASRLTELMARSLMLLARTARGRARRDGIDECRRRLTRRSRNAEAGSVNTFYLHPTDVGLPKAAPDPFRRRRA